MTEIDIKPNAPLLYQTLGFLETHPEQWDQGNWSLPGLDQDTENEPFACSARGCFAGWASIFAGGRWTKNGALVNDKELAESLPVSVYAQQKLGLTSYQADRLFNGSNTIEQMKEQIRAIVSPPKPQLHTITMQVRATSLGVEQLSRALDEVVEDFVGVKSEKAAASRAETEAEAFTRYKVMDLAAPCCGINDSYEGECSATKEHVQRLMRAGK